MSLTLGSGMLMATMPIAPPAFDIDTLALTIHLKAGSAYIKEYLAPANGGNGYWAWFGSPSAGISGTIDVCRRTHSGEDWNGDVLDGKQTLRLKTTHGAPMRALFSTADVRSGANTALPATITDIGVSNVESSTGTMWTLIKLVDFATGRKQVTGDWASIGTNATGNTLEAGNQATNAFATSTALSAGTWAVVMLRWSGTVKEMRINQGSWILGTAGSMNTNGEFTVGGAVNGTANAHVADVGVSLSSLSTATCDDIYSGLKALYPSAGLP